MLRRDLFRTVLGLGLGTLAPARTSLGAPALRVGAAKIDITPESRVALSGYLEPGSRLSEGVHDRLFARAFAFGAGASRIVLVSCDLSSMVFGAYLARPLLDRLSMRPDELLLCATHTHSGPLVTLHPSYPQNVVYTERLPGMLATVVDDAIRSLAPARLAVARGTSRVGVNRRRSGPDGRIEMAPNPDGPIDPELLVLEVTRPGGRRVGVLFSYACHSRSLRKTNRMVSGDVFGIAAQDVERAHAGTIAAAFAGASGDVDPVSVVDDFSRTGDAPPETERLGSLLASDVLQALADARTALSPGPVRSATARVQLPPKHHGASKFVETTVAALGDVAWVGLDCEASVEIGLAIKAASPFPATFIATHCNGWTGYLPVERQYAEGGYEVERTGFGPTAATVLVERVTDMLRHLWKQS
jgi:neutral ceramidase